MAVPPSSWLIPGGSPRGDSIKPRLTPRPAIEHGLGPFLGDVRPVELASRLTGWRRDGADVVLACATTVHFPEWVFMLGTPTEQSGRLAPGAGAELRVGSHGDGVVRFRYAKPGHTETPESPMLVSGSEDAVPPEVVERDGHLELALGEITVAVDCDTFRLEVRDRTGIVVWSTRPEMFDFLADGTSSDPAEDQMNRWVWSTRYAHPLGFTADDGEPCAFLSMELGHEEHVVGLGESYGPVDRRGAAHVLWSTEGLGNSSTVTYKPVPFFLSSAGYGVFVHTSNPTLVRVGERDRTATSIVVEGAAALDWFVVHGPEPRRIVSRYTGITGRPALPPRWSFGLWMSRLTYRSQEEVLEAARQVREHRIPCDVIHLDVGWFETEWVCDYRFDPERFPDPAGMVRELRALGLRLSIWQWPFVVPGTDMFEEARSEGLIVTDETGEPLVLEGTIPIADVALLDYTNPLTADFARRKIRPLLDLGVSVIKVDFGEAAPVQGVYAGASGLAAHNLFPLLYNRALWGITEEAVGPGNAVIWARSAWAGSQRYPVHWSGDGLSRIQDLACVLRSALSMGFSGFAFYSHDIGGMIGYPSPRTYVRWAQLGLLMSHARCHGLPPREPWGFGDEAEAIFRKYTELRYRLLPYFWGQASASVDEGIPLVRALALEFPRDQGAWLTEDEFMLGDSLLVAPVLDDRDERAVYLPAGEWTDFWSGERKMGGGWVDESAPLDHTPVFVRAGAVIPMGPVTQHSAEVSEGGWEIHFYPPVSSGEATLQFTEDFVVSIGWDRGPGGLDVRLGPIARAVDLVVHEELRLCRVNGSLTTMTREGAAARIRLRRVARPRRVTRQ